jgi:hypothetical protein
LKFLDLNLLKIVVRDSIIVHICSFVFVWLLSVSKLWSCLTEFTCIVARWFVSSRYWICLYHRVFWISYSSSTHSTEVSTHKSSVKWNYNNSNFQRSSLKHFCWNLNYWYQRQRNSFEWGTKNHIQIFFFSIVMLIFVLKDWHSTSASRNRHPEPSVFECYFTLSTFLNWSIFCVLVNRKFVIHLSNKRI